MSIFLAYLYILVTEPWSAKCTYNLLLLRFTGKNILEILRFSISCLSIVISSLRKSPNTMYIALDCFCGSDSSVKLFSGAFLTSSIMSLEIGPKPLVVLL